jgi:hypothetical protein
VFTPSSHYTWTTPNPHRNLPNQLPVIIKTSLHSNGDYALTMHSVQVSAQLGAALMISNSCKGQIPSGASCSVIVLYNPLKLCSTTGLAYDTLTVTPVSDAGEPTSWAQSYTITVTRTNCPD